MAEPGETPAPYVDPLARSGSTLSLSDESLDDETSIVLLIVTAATDRNTESEMVQMLVIDSRNLKKVLKG